MDTIIVIGIALVAVLYLYRHITAGFKKDAPSSGCPGCGACCGKDPYFCEAASASRISTKRADDKDACL